MNNSEYTAFEELEKLTDQELKDIVIKGNNLHIHTSKASVAKRILDARKQDKQLEAVEKVVEDVNVATKHLEDSNKGLLKLTSGLKEIVKLLNFFKVHWFPQQSVWIKVGAFLLTTVLLGIAINLVSDAISKFILHW